MRTHLDLFSGIGGFSLAARWCGLQTIGFSEIDPYASSVLKKHWPDVPNYGDIKNYQSWPELGAIFLITGGFPCQPFSLAGKRRGAADDRALWPQMRRVIAEARPHWVLAENVPGIIGLELDNCLSDLEALRYATGTIVIPACAVDARHRRDRVWIVANGRSEGLAQWKKQSTRQEQPTAQRSGDLMAHARSPRPFPAAQAGICSRQEATGPRDVELERCCEWLPEPAVGRVAHGIPHRVDRLRGLGNAIVPQVAAQIIRAMICVDNIQ